MHPKISAFFKRQETAPDPNSGGGEGHRQGSGGEKRKPNGGGRGELVSKKRSYAQFHLELGQPDFVLHTGPWEQRRRREGSQGAPQELLRGSPVQGLAK